MRYIRNLATAKDALIGVLRDKGIDPRYLKFGGIGDEPARPPTVPTDARSEFLANRAMGDWAEKIVAASLRRALPQWKIAHYGSTETIAAGEEGFKEFYLAGLDEVRRYGKRPDLLVFPSAVEVAEDISREPFERAAQIVKKSLGAMEVRSSKFEAIRYMTVRAQDKAAGRGSLAAREVPSFTVKVEDLKIVYRWIERHRIPQAYVQVFFDSIFMVNVLRIFQTIGSGKGFAIESPAKSQEKSTKMIPITCGEQVGKFNLLPTFEVAERVTRLGRHDAYVMPVGGDLQLDGNRVKALLLD